MGVKTPFGIILVFAVVAAGCDTRPTTEIDAARASLANAAASGSQYAEDSFKAAQDAMVELEAEISTQDSKWMKSYDRTRLLAESAREAGDRAAADATAARERAEAAAAKARAEAEERAKLMSTAVRVGGAIRNPVKVKDVPPEYPPVAKSARIGGTVQIEATIAPDGKVANATVVRSVPALDQAALDAVRQWEYRPTLVKGVPVPVIVNIAVNFTP